MLTLYRLLSSNRFFYVTLVIAALAGLWIALSALYPLAFDEYYHFGIIKIYAEHWSPVITQQPPEAALFGDITRLTSYLYHYLMSFPLRFFSLFTSDQMIQVVLLRIINVGFMVAGLAVFWRVLQNARLSKALVNAVLLFFAITPIVSLLAAQINYDNLLFLAAAVCVLFTQKIIQNTQVRSTDIVLLLSIGLLGVLVKYPFAAIYGVLVLYSGITLVRRYGWGLSGKIWQSFRATVWPIRLGLIILALLSVGLFAERFGGNQLRYGSPMPACEVVQSPEICANYSVWLRDQTLLSQRTEQLPFSSAFTFTSFWVEKIIEGNFVAFTHIPSGPRSVADPYGPIVTRPALPVMYTLGWLVFLAGVILVTVYARRLWQHKPLRLLIIVTASYLAVLWFKNFTDYVKIGQPVAIQARYTLLVLPFLFALFAQAASYALKNTKSKLAVAVTVLLLYVPGAGAFTYIFRSDAGWYRNDQTVIWANQTVRDFMSPFIYR